MTNKKYYSFGNPFKKKFRTHYCIFCGRELETKTHRKVVSQKSEEAKYYDFSCGSEGVMVGSCEFIHKVLYCRKCNLDIEFKTQINIEDIKIYIEKVEEKFKDKNLKISLCYQTHTDELIDRLPNFEDINCAVLKVKTPSKELNYKLDLCKDNMYERPYFFDFYKRQFIKFLKENL